MFRSRNDDGFRSRDHNGHRRTWIGFLFGWIVDAWYFVAGFFRQIFQFQWFWRPLRRFTKRFFALRFLLGSEQLVMPHYHRQQDSTGALLQSDLLV